MSPHVHEIAHKVRFEASWRREETRRAMKRSVSINFHHRVSGREVAGGVYLWTGVRKAGGYRSTNPPKSPTTKWLIAFGGYQEMPF